MAGNWLKMEASTPEKREVMAITVAMGWDDPDLTVGKLFRVWRWFDEHTIGGNAPGVTSALLDRIVGVTGISNAMESVGWLVIDDAGISLPKFDRHNGKTAKDRALTAKRVATHKANGGGNAEGNAVIVSGELPRIDKNKEKNKDKCPPNPPLQGGEADPPATPEKPKRERKPRIALKTFIENCMKAGEKPISGYEALLEYVEATGLPMEFVQLAWEVFKDEFLPNGTNDARLQADWRRHFLNYVRKGYYRLWFAKPANDGGKAEYTLSTQGVQAKAVAAHREAA